MPSNQGDKPKIEMRNKERGENTQKERKIPTQQLCGNQVKTTAVW